VVGVLCGSLWAVVVAWTVKNDPMINTETTTAVTIQGRRL